MAPVVGIVANPVSARDIRRVVANATSLQIADRANILLRVLAALHACGVRDVLMMPENGGIRAHVERGMMRARSQGEGIYPALHPVAMPITGTVADTHRATAEMRRAGVSALVVLGGDGTHRAVAADCGTVPIAGISTGTNNAFPEHREPTITGLATGLAVTGRVPPHIAFSANKRIDVSLINGANGGAVTEMALVDVALVTERYIGARALWRTENFRELYVTFADPEVIGMSAIAGLLEPVGRDESGGLMVRLSPDGDCRKGTTTLHAPIAPGMMAQVGITDWRRMPADVAFVPEVTAGSIALDGERELSFSERDRLSLTLRDDAFRTVNVAAVMRHAGQNRLLTGTPVPVAAAF
ncbi:acetoin catabolism protein X [Azospirillum sp. TSH100]|uniref:ATP-NAD kinase family protein n=1 Tax=Azospirillum sp. TSH100 TaxID=652764 RepID=UPI000D61C453|nr:NAD(+)/NADH kinase [Azospirillum sp. TSH100]PWC84419.1 acetoin catabolism protein X [Azospirillum sp. TSH100]QCG87674.1 acetoin catabolism protein X [Azospirillum sp. TSH100]